MGVARFGWWAARGRVVPASLRRRVGAAVLAGASLLLGLQSLQRPHKPAPTAAAQPTLTATLVPGQVAAPVRLVDPALATLLHPGARVDVLAAPEPVTGPVDSGQSPARVVASGIRVISVPRPGETAGEASGALVVLAVRPEQAAALAGAQAAGRLTVTIEPG